MEPAHTPGLDGPQLETARLLLRPPQSVDFEPWAAFFTDPEATRFLGGPRPRALVWRNLLAFAGGWLIQGFSAFSIIEKASGRWIGWTGPWYPEGWSAPEVGWCLSREVWGRGYALEAAGAAVDWAFETLPFDRLIHHIAPAHAASKAVARKLGAQCGERMSMPHPYEGEVVDLWSLRRDRWLPRSAGA
jgi:RimJ/RimL family protein N-acetyltransferase